MHLNLYKNKNKNTCACDILFSSTIWGSQEIVVI